MAFPIEYATRHVAALRVRILPAKCSLGEMSRKHEIIDTIERVGTKHHVIADYNPKGESVRHAAEEFVAWLGTKMHFS